MSSGSDSAVSVGDILVDRYQLDRFIAAGAMGEVYEATDRSLGRRVAIKVALRLAKLTGELEQRLLTEARAAAKLRGTHVAHIFEIGRLDDGTPFVVMEFLEGETLEDVKCRRGRVEVHEAIHWSLQTCLALAEAHAQGIVHRDIKPDNLFLAETPDGDVVLKVLDFGASAFMTTLWDGARSSELHVGTPLYMAPERITEPQSSDRRSDIWALGAVFYELVIGHAPFDDEEASVREVIDRTLTMDPASLHRLHPGISPRLDRVIGKCLEKELDQRYGDVAALARDLATFGRPGAHQIASRVARVWAKAKSRVAVRQPVASGRIPQARPKLPSAPILLTDCDAAAPRRALAPEAGRAATPRADALRTDALRGEALRGEPRDEGPRREGLRHEAGGGEAPRRRLPRPTPKRKKPKTVPPPRPQAGSVPLLLTRKKDD